MAHLNGIFDVGEAWHGADYEFHHEGVQTAFRSLCSRFNELATLTMSYLYGDKSIPGLAGPLTDMDRSNGTSEQTYDRIRLMNSKRDEVITALDHFVRFSRETLRRPG